MSRLAIICAASLLMSAFGKDKASEVQNEIELEIKSLLKEQLGTGEFYVYAIVTGPSDAERRQTAGILPYSSISIPKGILQDILERNFPKDDIKDLRIEVNIGFDKRIPEQKRALLEDVVRKRFGFDGQSRVLTVDSMELVSDRIAESERFTLERARMESAAERLRLENERVQLALQLKDLEIERLKKPIEAPTDIDKTTLNAEAPLGAVGAQEGASETGVGEAVEAEMGSAEFQLFKDAQLSLLGLVLGLLLFVSALFGGSMFVKGMNPLSAAIEAVGASIESAAKSAAPSQTSVTVAGDDSLGKEGGGAVAAGVPVQMLDGSGLPDEEFLKQVEDKIEILIKERNFSFFRVFSDMIADKATVPFAAAILVSISEELSKRLVKDVSIEDITKIKNFLATEGGLAKAKESRAKALTEFYGRIAMDEFMDSPLMEMRDLKWLTRMSTKDMASFVVGLTEDERPAFLTCLSPTRTKKIIDALAGDKDKEKVLRSLGSIDAVTEDKVRNVMQELARRMSGMEAQRSDEPKLAVDSARYLAAIAEELSESEQEKLFNALGGKDNLVEAIREHYIPFRMIAVLPKELVVEIFGERPDAQVAQIIFDSSDEIRNLVINALPEIRAESVRDELRVLDDDHFYGRRNRKVSARLQKEVSRYLLRLYSEGLISFGSKSGGLSAVISREFESAA